MRPCLPRSRPLRARRAVEWGLLAAVLGSVHLYRDLHSTSLLSGSAATRHGSAFALAAGIVRGRRRLSGDGPARPRSLLGVASARSRPRRRSAPPERRAAASVQQRPRLRSRRRQWLLSLVAGAGAGVILRHGTVRAEGAVVVADESGLLAPATEAYLGRLLGSLQDETGLRVRILCPPRDLPRSGGKREQYIVDRRSGLGMEDDGIIILAERPAFLDPEEPGEGKRKISPLQRSLQMQVSLISIDQPPKQNVLTQQYMVQTSARLGDPTYFKTLGPDAAVREFAENVAAAVYALYDKQAQGGVKARLARGPLGVLSREEVVPVLAAHGIDLEL